MKRLTPAQGQQLPRELRNALGAELHLLQVPSLSRGDIGGTHEKLSKAEHDRHLIVGFVRHSACKGADRLHALGTLQLRTRLAKIRHIDVRPYRSADPSGLVEERSGTPVDMPERVVLKPDLQL